MQFPGKLLAVAVALTATTTLTQAQAAEHASILLGQRVLDDFWEPIDEPFTIGFDFDSRPHGSGLGWEVATLASYDEDDDGVGEADLLLIEAGVGARYTFDIDRFHPYVGVGVSGVYADLNTEVGMVSFSESDWTVGGYVHGGFFAELGSRFTLGLDVRSLFGTEVDFGTSTDTDVDYVQVAVALGWTN